MRNRKMWWCVTAINKMLQPAKSPWSANPTCHNSPQNSHTVNSKSTTEKSTHDSSKKVNATQSLVNLLTSILVPICMAFQNQSLHQFFSLFEPCVDQSQCWSNLRGNPSCSKFVQTLVAINSSFFPRVNRNCFQGARTKSEEEMMCEDEMSEKVLQC